MRDIVHKRAAAAVRAQSGSRTRGSITSVLRATRQGPGRALRPTRHSMAQALSRYLDPEPIEVADCAEGKPAPSSFLLRRMRYKSDFPGAVGNDQRASTGRWNRTASGRACCATAILRDPRSPSKLIKLVQQPCLCALRRHRSARSQRAGVEILGYDGVRGARACP
jgi:hypothetical protein